MHPGSTFRESGKKAKEWTGVLLTSAAESPSYVQLVAADGQTRNREVPEHSDRIAACTGVIQWGCPVEGDPGKSPPKRKVGVSRFSGCCFFWC